MQAFPNCQSGRGNRLFELGLGAIALAFTAASSKADQAAIDDLLASEGRANFAASWLRHKGLDWAVDYLDPAAAPKAAAALEEIGS
jgi:type IV secretion system protein TrbE